MTFNDWYESYERDGGELMLFNTIDLEAAYRAGTEQLEKQLRTLATELLEAHDGCGKFIGEGDDGYFEPCQCEACKIAREVLA